MRPTEQLQQLWLDLKGFQEPVIVEGKSDEYLLAKLGFQRTLPIGGKSLSQVLQEVIASQAKRVLILTDFDAEGEQKAKTLSRLLEAHGIKVDRFMRKRFFDLFQIHKIEELRNFFKFVGGDVHGEACSIYDKIRDQSRFLNRRSRGKT
jgi:5S rRNA maturation endonuclease (ribonuclease M5)